MKKETRKKYGTYILNSLLGMCIYLFYGVIFNGYHPRIFPATCITFFLVSYWMARKEQSNARNVSLFFLMTLNLLLVLIFSERALTTKMTFYLFMMPASTFMGSWARKQKTQFMYFPLLLVFICVFILPNSIHYFRNTDAFQNRKAPEISYYSLNQQKVKFDKEMTVIDLWTTSCGVCFEEFPIFEKLKQDFEGNDNVQFYSANVPLKNDTREKTLATIKTLNYDYETVFAEKFEMIRDSLGISGFPHLLIIKDDTIRYLGDMETDRKIVLTNTKDVIHNLLE
ncbi:TlpA family protein disulfide reductase [Kordia sp.]|uniref:TlpA family protein disulfide reductase n=1 Tax=Kordia sp. TaxID=1965332 RepID=UPI003B5C51BA